MKFFPFFLWLGQSEIKINVSKYIFLRLGQNRREVEKPHNLFCLAKKSFRTVEKCFPAKIMPSVGDHFYEHPTPLF